MVENLSSVNALITGSVQGVFYRASVLEVAQRLNLTGWVKNLADGSVEVMAEGSRYSLEELVRWCRTGPPSAQVDQVSARFGDFKGEFRTFMIVR